MRLSFSSELHWGLVHCHCPRSAFNETELWLVLWSLYLLRFTLIPINLQPRLERNTVIVSELMLLITTSICRVSYKNRSWTHGSSWNCGQSKFSVPIPRCFKIVYANILLPLTAGIWKYLSVECPHVTFDQKDCSLVLIDTFYRCSRPNKYCYMFLIFMSFLLYFHALWRLFKM